MDFSNKEQLERWLVGKSSQVVIALAARAALRAFPAILLDLASIRNAARNTVNLSKADRSVLLNGFRALQISWVAARHSTSDVNLNAAANDAAAAASAIDISPSVFVILRDAVDAAGAASNTAYMTAAARDAALAAIYRTSSSDIPDVTARNSEKLAFAADTQTIDRGVDASELAGSPLWPGHERQRIAEYWAVLKHALLSANEDWDVWTDWYDGRFEGFPTNKSLELARAIIPDNLWKDGAKIVNAHIKRLIEESRQNPSRSDFPNWAARLASAQQATLGSRFVRRGEVLAIDPSGDNTDVEAVSDPVTRQLHDGVRRRAREFSEIAKRVTNQVGWTGLGEAATRFSNAVDCEIDDVPSHIGTVYESLVTLGSFLEFDTRLNKLPNTSTADPLDPEIRRPLADLVRAAAPWARRFPTARQLDDEAGAFLAKPDLYGPAASVIRIAEATNVISEDDAHALQLVLDAAERGEFQGHKAGARSIWSAKNLVSALAVVLSFEVGMIGNEAAEHSVIAKKGSDFYLRAEAQVLKLFEDAPADLKHALLAMIDDLRGATDEYPIDIPKAPRPEPKGRRTRSNE